MLTKWQVFLKGALPLWILVGLFLGNPYIEIVSSQDRMVLPENPTSQNGVTKSVFPIFDPDLCDQIFVTAGKLQNLCKTMKLEDLPNLGGLKKEDFAALTQAVLTPVEIFQNPDAFRTITKNPEELAHKLGFESVDHLNDIQPGACLIVGWVRITSLSNYKDGDDPTKIIIFSDSIILPLNDGTVLDTSKDARSSLRFTLFRKANEWHWTQRGLPNFIRRVDEYGNQKTGQKLVVEIPGLNLRFLGVGQGSDLLLIPFKDINFSSLELKAGYPLSANEVFAGLVPEAEKILEVPEEEEPVIPKEMVH